MSGIQSVLLGGEIQIILESTRAYKLLQKALCLDRSLLYMA